MAIGVRVEPELEQQLDQLAQRLGQSRSACVRDAIAQYVQRFGQNDEALQQSTQIAEHAHQTVWCDQVPDWSDWTA
ncbi:ribbon-helix-helix protein/ copG family [Synechococcus sp. A18-40]|nr:ribbon-helix-helix protein/ copG family [Synechococcus sp. A18-40]